MKMFTLNDHNPKSSKIVPRAFLSEYMPESGSSCFERYFESIMLRYIDDELYFIAFIPVAQHYCLQCRSSILLGLE